MRSLSGAAAAWRVDADSSGARDGIARLSVRPLRGVELRGAAEPCDGRTKVRRSICLHHTVSPQWRRRAQNKEGPLLRPSVRSDIFNLWIGYLDPCISGEERRLLHSPAETQRFHRYHRTLTRHWITSYKLLLPKRQIIRIFIQKPRVWSQTLKSTPPQGPGGPLCASLGRWPITRAPAIWLREQMIFPD